MDTKRSCYLVGLLFAFYLPVTHADTATAPSLSSEGEAPAAVDAPPAIKTTAQVWNRSKGAIVVSQPGRAQQTLEQTQSYQSQNYPQVPINILIPTNSVIKFITVTGQSGACTVPVCIFVQ
ncbi:hypothetical protein [Pseudomonas fluorescens]|uniref:Uncharacterized protein n=1 Tax=Pseudomonas fluorescens TaxID=294 RepID=A0A944DM02_PSEFL|nr:hypothetical protein [Pseudomonas fluorescens]MBT2298681.1 hypothetical protein [Pseudomonas fluorescens]MBT2310358.1 hypothetical protein [Pseudomonas fluorescens]MBT2312810.1 hypothetical protein [Pseudomonas fluorescens]MBT2320689.1 hypothetical protein [Pseudomonas fluorescens]MBT2332297.1 hypothetical protein [Pseudomonas fluorescens]